MVNFLFFLFSFCSLQASPPSPHHGVSIFGALKYKKDFKRFDYVNPNAPQQGSVTLGALGAFDNLNPFIIKGTAPLGLNRCFATLLSHSQDEPASGYLYVADSVTVDTNLQWISFTIHPKARFDTGEPLTADDVIFSFNSLRDQGLPLFKSYYKAVTRIEKISDKEIKFHTPHNKSRELPLILGEFPIFSSSYYKNHPFSETSLEASPSSGPYRVKTIDPGRSIVYEKVKNWWANSLPSQVGLYNFKKIKYDYYRDNNALFEAFKKGNIHIREENIASFWAKSYNFPAVKEGRVKKEIFPGRKIGMTIGLFFNTRKPVFSDVKVREALSYTLNFEWMNKTFFHNLYTRSSSYFARSHFDTKGKLEAEVENFLNPYRSRLSNRVFEKQFKLPSFHTPEDTRAIINKSFNLLKEAGWIIKDQRLINKKTGEPFPTLEFITFEEGSKKVFLHYQSYLKKLGITAALRVVDSATYEERRGNRDFDIFLFGFAQSATPGNEQREMWASVSADLKHSYNLAGVKDPLIDQIIEEIVQSSDYESLKLRVKALDRLLLSGFYMIPGWYREGDFLAYWDHFEKPPLMPSYQPFYLDSWWWVGKKTSSLNETTNP